MIRKGWKCNCSLLLCHVLGLKANTNSPPVHPPFSVAPVLPSTGRLRCFEGLESFSTTLCAIPLWEGRCIYPPALAVFHSLGHSWRDRNSKRPATSTFMVS